MPNIHSILRDHVTLQVECVDRLYLNGYVAALQRPNQLAYFLGAHRGYPLPSPALLGQIGERFVRSIHGFARRHGIPIVRFERGQRKDQIARRRFARFRGREGVVFIGVAQEPDRSFRATKRWRRTGGITFDFYRARVVVNHYYFYILDRHWGPGFIKFSSYAPFGVRVCLNGHEWAKRQLARRGIGYRALDNGFLSCSAPRQLQALCDRLSADDIESYFRRWLRRLPHPFSAQDREAGYSYRLSIWQLEYSLTHVFARPQQGRQFFEELLRENLDLGRPERIQLLFDRRVLRNTPSTFRTRVVQQGVQPKLSVDYKHSRLKQYFKEGRALRTETTINDPYDLGVGRLLSNFAYLRTIARHINRRLLSLERLSHNCALSERTVESIVLPTRTDGQHAPGLRFGQPRTMALLAAACHFLPTHNGFTNAMLRPRVAALHEPGPRGYRSAQMSYDLRRLRLKGLIQRLPRQNRYVLTPHGRRVALFFTKTYARILRPGLARLDPRRPADQSDPLASACRSLDEAIDLLAKEAHIAA